MGSCEATSAPVGPLGWPPCPEVHASPAEPPTANTASPHPSYTHQGGGQVNGAAPAVIRKSKSASRRTLSSEAGGPVPPLGSNGSGGISTVVSISSDTGTSSNNNIVGKTSQQQQQQASVPECAGCQRPIRERYLLRALDQLWHEECLKCSCCNCRLGEVGSTLFTKADLILCRTDYLRLYGSSGMCSACHKSIPAFEMVMRARGNVYHLECFACQQCNHRFCVGDRFYVQYGRILCEEDMYTAAEM